MIISSFMARLLVLLLAATAGWGQVEGDWVARDFRFHTGETMAGLRLHYTAAGKPARGPDGHVNNAVIIMHGTGGSGREFLGAAFGGELFGKGQPLDTDRYYIVMPDAIGHGRSSKPSDGLKMKFPHYDYEDMVRADYRLLTEGLGVDHLRLVMGTSMGAMHSWIWGYLYPDFMDALMPLASAPVEIAGRNRMFRAMIMQAIQNDPDWKGGEYTRPPTNGLIAAQYALWMMTSSPLQLHKANPTHGQADTPCRRCGKGRPGWTPTTCCTNMTARRITIRRRCWRRSARPCLPLIRLTMRSIRPNWEFSNARSRK